MKYIYIIVELSKPDDPLWNTVAYKTKEDAENAIVVRSLRGNLVIVKCVIAKN